MYDYVFHSGRAGVPMEVMGLMLGSFVDDYTITCVDVFAMPQVRFLIVSIRLVLHLALT
jgi:proteasome lid subunit RPN8/RPN11